ncbi:hypothetical protein BCL93_102222 [Onishia taeanensis]|uniref:MSHA biogenesis protein MshK n=1 Tax=Onishia taeanensis TaxID=284577 RepID=A0A328XVS7_9GAMM|nr:hypothetical protein [Halomonas taeanensis]RAR63483.1 hypothetical protein BCL93_102222 [Halomonas taeanensis]
MNAKSMATFMVLQMMLAGGSQSVPAATSVHTQGGGSVVVSSTRTAAGGSTVEAAVSGRNAVIDVNGDHVEIKDGRLTLNGVSYGRVQERSTVIYRIVGGEKRLLVDGVVRRPVKAGEAG